MKSWKSFSRGEIEHVPALLELPWSVCSKKTAGRKLKLFELCLHIFFIREDEREFCTRAVVHSRFVAHTKEANEISNELNLRVVEESWRKSLCKRADAAQQRVKKI